MCFNLGGKEAAYIFKVVTELDDLFIYFNS